MYDKYAWWCTMLSKTLNTPPSCPVAGSTRDVYNPWQSIVKNFWFQLEKVQWSRIGTQSVVSCTYTVSCTCYGTLWYTISQHITQRLCIRRYHVHDVWVTKLKDQVHSFLVPTSPIISNLSYPNVHSQLHNRPTHHHIIKPSKWYISCWVLHDWPTYTLRAYYFTMYISNIDFSFSGPSFNQNNFLALLSSPSPELPWVLM